jgi:predicted patatin/cPLA2 family phospholipase
MNFDLEKQFSQLTQMLQHNQKQRKALQQQMFESNGKGSRKVRFDETKPEITNITTNLQAAPPNM